MNDFACALFGERFVERCKRRNLSGKCSQWTIVDVATIAAGGVGVGIYPTSSPEQCEYIINHSDAEFVFVDSAAQLRKVAESCGKLQKVKEIICLEEISSGSAASMCGKALSFREASQPDVEAQPQLDSLANQSESQRLSAHQAAQPQIPTTNYKDFIEFGRQNRDEFLPKIEKIRIECKTGRHCDNGLHFRHDGKAERRDAFAQIYFEFVRIAQKFRADSSR